MIKKFSNREKSIFVLCVSVVAFYVGYNFIFKNLYQKIIDLEKTITIQENKLRKNLSAIKREPMVDAQYKKYSSAMMQDASDEREMTSILSEISSVADSIDLRVADLKPKRVRNIDFYNNFSVSLTVDGDLLTIVNFMYILQNKPHLFDIEEVRLDKGSIRSSKIKCRLVLSRVLIP